MKIEKLKNLFKNHYTLKVSEINVLPLEQKQKDKLKKYIRSKKLYIKNTNDYKPKINIHFDNLDHMSLEQMTSRTTKLDKAFEARNLLLNTRKKRRRKERR